MKITLISIGISFLIWLIFFLLYKFKIVSDKTIHVYSCWSIGFIFIVLSFIFIENYWSVAIGIAVSFLIALGKEYIWDKMFGKGTFNMLDLLSSGWGVLLSGISGLAYVSSRIY